MSIIYLIILDSSRAKLSLSEVVKKFATAQEIFLNKLVNLSELVLFFKLYINLSKQELIPITKIC